MSALPWWMIDAATVMLAFVAGIFSGAFSMGGHILMKPGIRVLGASALEAVGTTVPLIAPTLVAAGFRYARESLVDWSTVRIAVPAGVVGATAGSLAAPRIPGDGHLLQFVTAGLLLMVAVRMIRGRRSSAALIEAVTPSRHVRRGVVATIAALSGAASGILGVGGGLIMVPGFSQWARLPLRVAIATSLVCSAAFALPATITHAIQGTIHWRFAILLTLGALPGARLGAQMTIRMADRRLGSAVGVVMAAIAVIYGAGEIVAWMNAD